MHYVLFALLLLAAPRGAFALTWDFDDGSTWGWTARATPVDVNVEGIDASLQGEVVDGVWRMALIPGQSPMVQLISPVIGEDSALFDHLTLRVRFIHHSPIEGRLWMHWSNVAYNRRTDYNVNRARFARNALNSIPSNGKRSASICAPWRKQGRQSGTIRPPGRIPSSISI